MHRGGQAAIAHLLGTAGQRQDHAGIRDRQRNQVAFHSYKKANRTSLKSFQGIGDSEAIKILGDVKRTFNVPLLTDVHSNEEIALVVEVADVLQIPAFLCRQTELLLADGQNRKSSEC